MFDEKSYEMAQRGEIVSTRSALAFDEELLCKKCGSVFTLIEGNYETSHPVYEAVKLYGIQCPSCKHVNLTYAKSPSLVTLEAKLNDAPYEKRPALRAKYQRLFLREQKQYMGEISVVS